MPLAAGLILIGIDGCRPAARADPVKGEATFSAAGGYARLVLKLAEDVDSEVTTAGSIVVIRFKRPVDIPVDQLVRRGARLCRLGAARSRRLGDPAVAGAPGDHQHHDRRRAGVRRSVARYWTGAPPSLPPEVIRELAERARAAERALAPAARRRRRRKKRPPIRVRASVQPTFVRFVFEMPDGVGVSSVLNDQKLTLSFNAVLNFDLADAKVAAPPNIASINQKIDGDTSAVEIALIGDVDVHSFREDKNYIVDVAFQQAEKPSALLPAGGGRLCRRSGGCRAGRADGCRRSGRVRETCGGRGGRSPARSCRRRRRCCAKQANIEIKPDAAPSDGAAPRPRRRAPAAGRAGKQTGACRPETQMAAHLRPRKCSRRRAAAARPGDAGARGAAEENGRCRARTAASAGNPSRRQRRIGRRACATAKACA